MADKARFWTRVKKLFRGKTMTYADYEGVTASEMDRHRSVDPMVTVQQAARNGGVFPSGGGI